MQKILEMKERQSELVREARVILNKAEAGNRNLSKSEQTSWDKLMTEVEALSNLVKTSERQLGVETRLSQSEGRITNAEDHTADGGFAVLVDGREVRMLAPGDSFRSAVCGPPASGEKQLSFRRTLRGLISNDWSGAEAEKRALSSGGAAGFLLAPELSAEVIDLARAQSNVMKAGARTIPITGETLLARLKSDPNVFWRPESVTTTTDTGMDFDRIRLVPKTVSCLVKLPIELQDAANIGDVVANAITEALAGEIDRVLMYGDGASEPKGLRNYISDADQPIAVQDPTGTLGSNGYDEFAKAVEGIEAKNFNGPFSYLWSPRSKRQLATTKTGITNDLQLLPSPDYFKAMSGFVSSRVLDTFASTESDVFVGQFNQLLVGLRAAITIEVSREAGTSFADLEVWIRGHARLDAALARAGAFQIITGIEA